MLHSRRSASRVVVPPTPESEPHSLSSHEFGVSRQPDSAADVAVFQNKWLDTCKERLNRLRHLPDNWDSYGAVPPEPSSFDRLWRLLRGIARQLGRELPIIIVPPFIVPAPDGGFQIEWDTTVKRLEIEVPAGYGVVYPYVKVTKAFDRSTFQRRPDLFSYDEGTAQDLREVVELLRWIHPRMS